jgi:hypothetical protein
MPTKLHMRIPLQIDQIDGVAPRVSAEQTVDYEEFTVRKTLVPLFFAVLVPFTGAFAQTTPPTPLTLFQFVSAPGDYIGQGQTVILTPTQVTFNTQNTVGSNVVSFYLNNFSISPSGPYIFWSVDFSAPNGAPLAVGTYLNATRYPFQAATVPGLAIYGDGRGCNQDFGQFQVKEIAYDSTTGLLDKFAADFVQTCESLTAPALIGAIRYNSSIPAPELFEPVISIANPRNVDGCYEATSPAGALVNASATAVGAANLTFSWATSTGLTHQGATFSVPVALGQTLSLTLTATDPVTGNSATATSQLCSTDTTPPVVTILSPVAGQSYTRLPRLTVQVTDAVDKHIKQVSVTVGETASYALDESESLHATLTARHAIGDMIVTEITVSATDASGNTGQSSVTVLIQKDLR